MLFLITFPLFVLLMPMETQWRIMLGILCVLVCIVCQIKFPNGDNGDINSTQSGAQPSQRSTHSLLSAAQRPRYGTKSMQSTESTQSTLRAMKYYFSLKRPKLSFMTVSFLALLFSFRLAYIAYERQWEVPASYPVLTLPIGLLIGLLSVFAVDYYIQILIHVLTALSRFRKRKAVCRQSARSGSKVLPDTEHRLAILSNPAQTVWDKSPKQGFLTDYWTESFQKKLYFGTLHMFLFTAAVIIVTLCSECSPLYPFNSWDDANCFFTVGKSMLSGMVPYRDLVEQKGTLLYALHALAALISYDSFIGVYVLEILCCYLFMLGADRALALYLSRHDPAPEESPDSCPSIRRPAFSVLVPVFCAVAYCSASFGCGDSAEELCMPLLIYAFFIGLKMTLDRELPSRREALLIGITSGCVLWIKFTMLGMYLGWMAVPIYLTVREKKPGKLVKMILIIITGVLLSTLPFILYFGAHHAIGEWMEIYFYNNIFLYSSVNSAAGNSVPENIWYGLFSIWNNALPELLTVMGGILWAVTRKDKMIALYAVSVTAGLILTVYGGGRSYVYYAFVFWIPALFGLFGLIDAGIQLNCDFFRPSRSHGYAGGLPAAPAWLLSLILSAGLIVLLNPNIELTKFQKEDLPQYQVKAVIDSSGIEDPSLLNYGFLDGGFYTVTRIVPCCRYFCSLNTPLEEMGRTQACFVEHGITDFVIAQGTEIPTDTVGKCYDLVYSCTDPYGGQNCTYYLYRKRSNESYMSEP